MIFNILASDPGARNYGIALIRLTVSDITKPKFSIVRFDKLKKTVYDMKFPQLTSQRKEYIANINSFLREAGLVKADINVVICERFMTRGLQGTLIENVSYMIGVLHSEFSKASFRAIPAAEWKNAFRRKTGHKLNAASPIYKALKKKRGISSHELDAILLGLYSAHAVLRKKGFDFIDMRKLLNGLPSRKNKPSAAKMSR